MAEKKDGWSEEARPIGKGERAFSMFRSSHPQSRETRGRIWDSWKLIMGCVIKHTKLWSFSDYFRE